MLVFRKMNHYIIIKVKQLLCFVVSGKRKMAVQARDFKFDLNWVFRVLRRFWLVILAAGIIGTVGAFGYLKMVKPKYRSSLKFLVWNETVAKAVRQLQQEQDALAREQEASPVELSDVALLNLDTTLPSTDEAVDHADAAEMSQSILMYNDLINRSMAVGLSLINDYRQLIEDSRIADEVRRRLEKKGLVGRYGVRAVASPRSTILTIEVGAENPELARVAAEMTMEVFKQEQQRLMGVQFAQKISDATLPTYPYFPNYPRVLLFGILLGLMVGYAVGALLDYLDYSVKSPDDLLKLGLSPLGNVPEVRNLDEILPKTDWPGQHKYHLLQENLALLKINLRHRSIDNPLRTILITSDAPGCGKSTNAILLAQTLAASENTKVLLIDCDLRKPSLFMKLKQNNKLGLVDCLLDFAPDMELEKYLAPSVWANVDLMTHGQVPQRPADFFESRRFAELLKLLQQRYRYIILDGPPVSGIADPLLISQQADAVILVVACGKTRVDHLQHLLNTWPDFASRILGVLLNRYHRGGTGSYDSYYGGYYAAAKPQSEQKASHDSSSTQEAAKQS